MASEGALELERPAQRRPVGALVTLVAWSLPERPAGGRAVAERANAALVMRWHPMRCVTSDPATVGVIAAAALVLTRFETAYGQG